MKLLEYEAKKHFAAAGIPVPKGELVRSPGDLAAVLPGLPDELVLKAQLEVGGRGKAGGIVPTTRSSAVKDAEALFSRKVKGLSVREVLAEEKLAIAQEFYCSVAVDRSSKQARIMFTEAGGVDIEEIARKTPERIRSAVVPLLMRDLPGFMIRDLCGSRAKEVGPVINRLYKVFLEKDAMLAEINPLALTDKGLFAADAKLIVDDNALARQGIAQNRDLSVREREAEAHGFSYVDLSGNIGVIGNGAGLTMATIDLIEYYAGAAANFLDVGGGADQERVMHAVRLVAANPGVKVIIVNLLGGITRCDEVARGIIAAGVPQKVFVRLAGTNEEEGRRLLSEKGYEMLDTMEQVVKASVEAAR